MEPGRHRVGRRRARATRVLGPALVVSLLSGTAHGAPQEDRATPARRPPDEQRWIAFAQEVELAELLELCSGILGAHVEYDPTKAQGIVRVRHELGYSGEELWQLANRELVARGLATVQVPGSDAFRVVPVADAKTLARLEEPGLDGATAGYLRVMFEPRHRAPDSLVETVRLLLSKDGGVVASARESAALVVSDFAPHVRQALAVLATLDVPRSAPAAIEVPLAHTSALAVGSILERVTAAYKQIDGEGLRGKALTMPGARSLLVVAPAGELAWWRATIERFDRPEPAVTVDYAPRRFGLRETARLVDEVVRRASPPELVDSWRMVVDELTGTLVVTTTPSRHAEIEALLARVEAAETEPRPVMRAFEVENRQVAEVFALLQKLLDEGALDAPAGTAVATGAAERAQGPSAPLPEGGTGGPVVTRSGPDEPRVTLTADEQTNRILAFGPPHLLEQLAALVADLDRRHGQILVEAMVVALNDSEARDLGVELRKLGASGDGQYAIASLFGLGSASSAATELPALAGSGFSGAVLDPGDFSALVRALEVVNRGRALTMPKVLVTNNQEATLDSVLQTPFASTNASQTVATTSFGGTQDAGTSIRVKPQVASGELIVLDYSVSLSTFVGDAPDPALPPPRQQNKLQSVVTIPDGHTVVVGGLEVETEADAESRVPILGRIPLVGSLFKNRSRSKDHSRFFVFLRCSVMRSELFEDLRFVTERDRAAVALPPDWPRVEPRVIR